jgi:hypothetical protein
MGGFNYKNSSSSTNKPAAYHGNGSIRVNNKKNSGNISPRKRKSPHNINDGQQTGDDDHNGAKMGGNHGIILIEKFFCQGPRGVEKGL